MDYDLDGKMFRSVSNTDNGEVGAETFFHYRQSGDVVTATYSGGEIVSGHLIAKVLANGQLDMRYHHLNRQGEFMLGQCISTPRRLPDGRLSFSEQWQWLTGDRSSGQSEIEEASRGSQFTPAAIKPTVTIADVEKLDIRVGTIVSVEDVPKSEKLLKLTVDCGDHTRTILAGMKKERSNPQEIVGLQALFVVNLEPKKMAGEVSHGMLFDIGYADGITPVLATPERAVPNGVRAG